MNDSETNPHTWQDYTETARRILIALAQVQWESDGRFVKCTRVIRQHLESISQLTDSAQRALADERKFDRVVDDTYRVIVGLYFDSTDFRMIRGQGNFGTPNRGFPPAGSLFTEISLTDRGRPMVAENSR
ncbi:hypothetical protein OAG71_03370 [bacterium]|nr:hypothetical protein [bacterium]